MSANLARLLAPRHIAFVGGRDAEIAIGEARRIGFAGAIWPVNPRRDAMAGIGCFASVDALPEAPDATFLAVPAGAAVETVRALAARGAGGVVCYSAGFGEKGNAAGEAALIAAAGGMALIGPNCYGLINYLDRAALWPFAHGGDCPGYGAAIVTQSGMLASDLTMNRRSVPLTHMISIGNQAALAFEDLIPVLAAREEVRAISLHVEGLRSPARFAEAALDAVGRGIPVVVLKTGASRIGGALTVSHTGSLAGEDALYDALFARSGVIRVPDPAALLETLKFLCIAGAPRGRRLAGFTCSGGGATLLADRAEAVGLEFPPPADRQGLAALLPAIATVSNPLDYTTPIWGDAARTGPVFAKALAGGADAAVLVQDYPAPGLDESLHFYRADADAFVAATRTAGVPAAVVSLLPENIDAATRAHFVAEGAAPMQGVHEALDAIAAAAGWAEARARIAQARPAPLLPGGGPGRLVGEAEGKAELRAAGIAVPEGREVSGAGAAAAAEALGGRVALKMCGPAHKTEAGAVALDLAPGEVAGAVARMQRQVPAAEATDRFLVERMLPPPVAELLVGIRSDPGFGLAMTIGSGGVLAELVGDVATVLLPCGEPNIRRALERLRVMRLLAGFRGRPGVDIGELVATLARLARHVADHADRIAEIEINPLFAYPDGAVAVDVLMQVRPASA